MHNPRCLFLLIGMSICSIAVSHEATVYTIYPEEAPIYHEASGKSIDSLILQLGDKNPRFQQEAVSAIKEMNVPDDQILLRWARLTKLLLDGRVFEFTTKDGLSDAVFRLIDLDKALDGVLHAIRSANRTVYGLNSEVARRADLARHVIDNFRYRIRLSKIKLPPGAVPLLADALREHDPETCEIAAEFLGTMPADAKAAVPALFDALGNESGRVRTETVSTLKKIGEANPDVQSEVAEKLVELLSAPSFVIYYGHRHRDQTTFHARVAQALAAIGPAAMPSLLNALDTTDTEVRYYAAIALAQIDSEHAETTIPILAEALASPHLQRRTSAVDTLETLATEQPTFATKIAPIFQEILRTTNPAKLNHLDDLKFYGHVRGALARISPKK